MHGDLVHARVDAIEPMPVYLEKGEEQTSSSAKKGEPRLIHNAKTSVSGAEPFRHDEVGLKQYRANIEEFISSVHPASPARAVCSGDLRKVVDGYNLAHGLAGNDYDDVDGLEEEARTLMKYIRAI